MSLFMKQKQNHRCRKQTYSYKRGWGEINEASGINRYTSLYKETQMYRTDFGTLWETVRVGCSERTALKQVYYQG